MAMILRNPYLLLYDLGFIFSFSALAGLVYFSQRRQLKVTKKIFHTSVLTTLKQLR